MTGASHRAAKALWRHRLALGLAAALLTLLALTVLPALQVSNSLEVWYPADGRAIRAFRDWQQTFGGDEIVVVAVSRPRGFEDDAGIEFVAELTDRFLDIPGVADVTSLVTVPVTMRAAAERLVGEGGRTTTLLVRLMPGERFEEQRHRVLGEIRATVDATGVRGRYAGYGVIYDALNEASTRGSAALIAGAHVTMILLLWLLFRRPLPVLLTLLSVGAATTWTMALYVLSGRALNMVTMALPTLVWVIGTATCVHLLRSIQRQGDGAPHADRVVRGVAAVIRPCSVACVTTAAGFLALAASGMPVVRDLGLFGAAGMAASFAASLMVVSAGASFHAAVPRCRDRRVEHVARSLHRAGTRYPRSTLATFLILTLPAAYGVSRLEVDTNSIGYLPEDHPVRRDSDFVEATIGPYMPLEFVVTADDVTRPAIRHAVRSWQSDASGLPGVGWSLSLLDVVGDRPFADGLERLQSLSPALAATLISGERQLRVSFATPVASAAATQHRVERLLRLADFPDHATVEATGYTALYTRIVDRIVQSQVRGFGIGMLLILSVLAVSMRSMRRLLLAIPANLLPVFATLGLMGLAGIPLDVATAMIATVILGLVVDDSVHLLHPHGAPGCSLRLAVGRSGGTLLLTTIVLCCGFLVFGLAGIRSVAWFGLLTAFALSVAIIADLMLLPALATLFVRDSSEKNQAPISSEARRLRMLQRNPT